MSTLDDQAEKLWTSIKKCDLAMRKIIAEREGHFQQYNEVLALLRDRDRAAQHYREWDTVWDNAAGAWSDRVVPLPEIPDNRAQ